MYGRADGLYIIMPTLVLLYTQYTTAAPERFIIIIVVVHVYVCKTCGRLFETVRNKSLYYSCYIVAARGVNRMTRRRTVYIRHIYNYDQDAYEKSELRTEFCSASIKNDCIFFSSTLKIIPSTKNNYTEKWNPSDKLGGPKIQ